MKNGIDLKEVKRKRKLFAALELMRLSVFEVNRMCVVDDKIPTAAWAFNLKDRTGRILIGGKLLDSWSVMEIAIAIEHELLHYSIYSAYRSQYEALHKEMPEIFNITSDGAIWKALRECSGSQHMLGGIMKKLGLSLPKNPFHVVMNPFMTPGRNRTYGFWGRVEEQLGPAATETLGQIWKDVHEECNIYKASVALRALLQQQAGQQGSEQQGSGSAGSAGSASSAEGDDDAPQKSPSESAKEILESKPLEVDGYAVRRIPEDGLTEEEINDGNLDPLEDGLNEYLEQHAGQMQRFIGRGNQFSDTFSKAFDILKVYKKKVNTKSFKKFLEKLKIRNTLEECSSCVKTSMLPNVSRTQPYVYNLSRLGITYAAIGLSGKIIPLWWNKMPENAKPKLAIYVDTSPSMDTFKGETVFLIGDLLSEIPSKIFGFSGSVIEMSAREFSRGKYKGGSSTCFDSVMQHFLQLRGYDDCIIITDGESGVSADNIAKLKKSRKRVYACYMVEGSSSYYTNTLKCVAKSSFIVRKNR